MDALYLILVLVAILAIIYKLWVQDGYSFKPMFDDTGKFQFNVIGSIIASLVVAIPVINATPLIGDPVYVILTVFFTVAGIPMAIEHILTKSPLGNPAPAEPEATLPDGEV
jgi:hypothetical protein